MGYTKTDVFCKGIRYLEWLHTISYSIYFLCNSEFSPQNKHILLGPLNYRLLSVDQCRDGSNSCCFPNQSSMKCFTAFVRALVLSFLFKAASNHLEPVTRGIQTPKRETFQNRFLHTYWFSSGFLGPKCPEISRRRLGRWSWWKGGKVALRGSHPTWNRPKWQEHVESYSPLVHHSHPNYFDISWQWTNYSQL